MSIVNKLTQTNNFQETFPTVESLTAYLDSQDFEDNLHTMIIDSAYKQYCESCTDEPLSFECWVHTDISSNDNFDDLPF